MKGIQQTSQIVEQHYKEIIKLFITSKLKYAR